MADVAKLAGVSHQTVSRVINSSEHVKEETRDRVLAAMRMLDYRPNSVARALSFLAVGAVLLLGGFFYQRLSARLESRQA